MSTLNDLVIRFCALCLCGSSYVDSTQGEPLNCYSLPDTIKDTNTLFVIKALSIDTHKLSAVVFPLVHRKRNHLRAVHVMSERLAGDYKVKTNKGARYRARVLYNTDTQYTSTQHTGIQNTQALDNWRASKLVDKYSLGARD